MRALPRRTNGGFTTGTAFRASSGNVATNNVAAQTADANSLLNFYKSLIALRRAHPSLAQGTYEHPASSGTVMSYQRAQGAERTVVVINYGTSAAAASLANLPANAVLTPLLPAGGAGINADAAGNATANVGAQSVAVFQVN